MHFEQLEGLLNQISEVISFPLAVINFITQVGVFGLEQVHDWQDLSIVRHKGFSDGVGASNKSLQDFQSDTNNFWVSSVQSSLDWNNQLGDDWQDFGSTFLKHVENTLHGEESVWVHFLSDTLEKDWQVVMVVELLNFYFPVDFVLGSVLNGDWKISSVVKESELRNWNMASVDGSSYWFLGNWLQFWSIQACALSSETITLLEDCSS